MDHHINKVASSDCYAQTVNVCAPTLMKSMAENQQFRAPY